MGYRRKRNAGREEGRERDKEKERKGERESEMKYSGRGEDAGRRGEV